MTSNEPRHYTLGKQDGYKLFQLLYHGEHCGGFASQSTIQHISNDCVIDGGDLYGGVFCGGEFHGGSFSDGWFYGGVFHGGTYCGGQYYDGEFIGGRFTSGEYFNGAFHGGRFNYYACYGGEFRDGYVNLGPDIKDEVYTNHTTNKILIPRD